MRPPVLASAPASPGHVQEDALPRLSGVCPTPQTPPTSARTRRVVTGAPTFMARAPTTTRRRDWRLEQRNVSGSGRWGSEVQVPRPLPPKASAGPETAGFSPSPPLVVPRARASPRLLSRDAVLLDEDPPSCPHFTPATPLKALYPDTVMLVCYGGLRLQHTDRGAGDTARPVTHTQVPRLSSSLFRASAVLHLWDRPRRPLPHTALGQFAVEVEPPTPHPEPIPLASPGPHEGSCCVQTLLAFPWVSWG